jgi:hypothetical protein
MFYTLTFAATKQDTFNRFLLMPSYGVTLSYVGKEFEKDTGNHMGVVKVQYRRLLKTYEDFQYVILRSQENQKLADQQEMIPNNAVKEIEKEMGICAEVVET